MKKVYLIGLLLILLLPLTSCSNQSDTEELARAQGNVTSLEKEIELKNNEIELLNNENKALNEKINELETENSSINQWLLALFPLKITPCSKNMK